GDSREFEEFSRSRAAKMMGEPARASQHSGAIPMRLSLILFGALLVTLPASSADFPAPDKLPSKPGLPDPTVKFDGSKVVGERVWESQRRPELKQLFEHYMFGRYPAKPDKFAAKVL